MRTAALLSILIASLVASPITNKATELTDVTDVADSADLEVVDDLVCGLLGCKPNHKADTRRGGNKRKEADYLGEKEIIDVEVEEELEGNEDLDISIKLDEEEEEEEEEEIDVIITEETDEDEPEQTPPYSKKDRHGKKKSGKYGKKGSKY